MQSKIKVLSSLQYFNDYTYDKNSTHSGDKRNINNNSDDNNNNIYQAIIRQSRILCWYCLQPSATERSMSPPFSTSLYPSPYPDVQIHRREIHVDERTLVLIKFTMSDSDFFLLVEESIYTFFDK